MAAVMYKRNSVSSVGGYTGSQKPFGVGAKRPPEPTENEKILAQRTEAQVIRQSERRRQQDLHRTFQAACRIQRAWRRYRSNKRSKPRPKTPERHTTLTSQFETVSKENVRRKRLRATQEEWERQIAALTIQLAWRKYFRRKLLRSLHPNRRQLLMWDPEVVALKQHALVNYIYSEHIQAPFWHPTLKAQHRPIWLRFIPSAAAVSYNFAVDQYVPWVARLGAQPSYPDPCPSPGASVTSGQDDQAQPSPGQTSPAKTSVVVSQGRGQSSGGRSEASVARSNPGSQTSKRRTPASGSVKSSRFSYNMKKKQSVA